MATWEEGGDKESKNYISWNKVYPKEISILKFLKLLFFKVGIPLELSGFKKEKFPFQDNSKEPVIYLELLGDI